MATPKRYTIGGGKKGGGMRPINFASKPKKPAKQTKYANKGTIGNAGLIKDAKKTGRLANPKANITATDRKIMRADRKAASGGGRSH